MPSDPLTVFVRAEWSWWARTLYALGLLHLFPRLGRWTIRHGVTIYIGSRRYHWNTNSQHLEGA